jgi:hypothetical protein
MGLGSACCAIIVIGSKTIRGRISRCIASHPANF